LNQIRGKTWKLEAPKRREFFFKIFDKYSKSYDYLKTKSLSNFPPKGVLKEKTTGTKKRIKFFNENVPNPTLFKEDALPGHHAVNLSELDVVQNKSARKQIIDNILFRTTGDKILRNKFNKLQKWNKKNIKLEEIIRSAKLKK